MATPLLTFDQAGNSLNYTPGGAVVAGTPVQHGAGDVGVPANDIAAGELGASQVRGVFRVPAASATTWSDGDELWWDASASQVVKKNNALEGEDDFRLGVAHGAKANGASYGYCRLNEPRPPFDPIVFEFDCEAGTLNEKHTLVPSEMNPNGLLITGVYAIVTEVFAGATEDQGVVTVEDGDGNAIITCTVADAGADAAGDVRLGYRLDSAAAGDVAKTVAAGKKITGKISQKTGGAGAAGKMKIYVTAIPLV